MLIADCTKRYYELKGKRTYLLTGTDEHGMKIQQAADRAKQDPGPFCDEVSETFRNLAKRANISYDIFMRTTSSEHRDTVQHVWSVLEAKGLIYSGKHEGWYSVSDETFYPENGVEDIVQPATGKKVKVSIETGKEVEWAAEQNYHFRLSAMRDELLEFYELHPDFVTPPAAMREVTNTVKEGLKDLSVSRPIDRLSWGVPVPGDSSQTIYVWLDALLNYITATGYPWKTSSIVKIWPADLQIVGKDIIKFHAIYWPAFLMALGLSPPNQILSHGHWLMNEQKMSKTIGNVVNPFFAFDRFGVDTVRYFLIGHADTSKDSNYDNEEVARSYKLLQSQVGNFLNRLLKTNRWSLKDAIKSFDERKERDPFDSEDALILATLKKIPNRIRTDSDSFFPKRLTGAAVNLMQEANKYITIKEPWSKAKAASRTQIENENYLNKVVFLCGEALRFYGIIMQPIMPTKMTELLTILGVAEDRRTYEWLEVGKDLTYGTTAENMDILFPNLEIDDTKRRRNVGTA
jgi:methionyl-tRNA synthetase